MKFIPNYKRSLSTILLILFLAIHSTLFSAFINPYKDTQAEVAQTELPDTTKAEQNRPTYRFLCPIVNPSPPSCGYSFFLYSNLERYTSQEIAIKYSTQYKKQLSIVKPLLFIRSNNLITSEDEDANLNLS